LIDNHENYWAPVGGFAWDVFGNGKSSLRGGFGLTYYETAGQGCYEGICLGYPTVNSVNLTTSPFDSPAGATPPPTAPTTSGEDIKNYRASHIETYSLSWQQQFGTNWIASVAGAGSKQRAGSIQVNINQPGPATVNGVNYDFNPNLTITGSGSYASSYYAPYQGYGNIAYNEIVGMSNWDALELSLKHQTTKNLYLSAAYTWSHGLDNYGGNQNVRNLAAAYGNSGNDVPQVFTVSAIYYLPRLQYSRLWVKELLGGWQASDMTTIQSGGFGTMGISAQPGPVGLGLATRPNQVAPVTYPKQCRHPSPTSTWFSTSSYGTPAAGYFGNVRNSTLRE